MQPAAACTLSWAVARCSANVNLQHVPAYGACSQSREVKCGGAKGKRCSTARGQVQNRNETKGIAQTSVVHAATNAPRQNEPAERVRCGTQNGRWV